MAGSHNGRGREPGSATSGEIEIDGLVARFSGKRACAAWRKRLASCELRFRHVTLPATAVMEGAEPIRPCGVHVVEAAAPEDEDPVSWLLLTSVDVTTAREAAEIVVFYLQRWKIEDWFRVLKSGCRVEHLLFRTADRVQRAVAINAVIAWRIMLMTRLRSGPHVHRCRTRVPARPCADLRPRRTATPG